MLTIETIRKTVRPLARKYGRKKVELFGSYASGTAMEHSDADFLLTFAVPVPSILAVEYGTDMASDCG